MTDGNGETAQATVAITVGAVNDAPTTSAVTLTAVVEDNNRIITEAELLANASDIEGDALSVTGLAISSGNGSVVDNGDGTWTYTPTADDESSVEFSYEVTDGQDSVVGSATLDILPVNDAPEFVNLMEEMVPVTVEPDATFVLDVIATDPDGDFVTFSLGDQADEGFFVIDSMTGALRFSQTPDFAFLGTAGQSPMFVEVIIDDGLEETEAIIQVSIPEFAVPTQTVTTTNDEVSTDEADREDNNGISGIDLSTVSPVGMPVPNNVGGVDPRPSDFVDGGGNSGGVDDFNFSDEGFAVAPLGSEIDLGLSKSDYKGVGFVQETELVSQQLADTYASRRGTGNVISDDAQLAAMFWQNLDSSNEDYLQRNFDADNAKIVAASAGLLSAGLLFAVYGGSIAITTLATQLPAWKSLDISPLISAFDEDEESIHEIVDG